MPRAMSPCAEPQQREAGLRQAAPGAGLAIAGLGRLERAAQPVQLGQLVDRLPDGRLGWRSGQPLARALGLVGRLAPGAVEAHQLGAEDEAVAAERDHVGLRLATSVRAPRSTPARAGGRTSTGTPR